MKSAYACVLMAFVVVAADAQLKSGSEQRPSVTGSMVRSDDSGLLFGWFDPGRLVMRHSYSLSYSTFGGQSLSVGMYTNSLLYQFSGPISMQMDVSLMHSPFNSFGSDFSKKFSGVYLTRAQLDYRPYDNLWLQIQFRQVPPMYWLGNSGSFQTGFFNGTPDFRQGQEADH